MANHVAFGTLSGALPSGRRKYTPFTPGLTPAASANGSLLQNIQTVASLDPPRPELQRLLGVCGAADGRTRDGIEERMSPGEPLDKDIYA